MAGQIKRMIDSIVEQRAQGNPTIASSTRTKLILKGINPQAYTPTSADDPAVIARLRTLAGELGVRV